MVVRERESEKVEYKYMDFSIIKVKWKYDIIIWNYKIKYHNIFTNVNVALSMLPLE